MQVTVTTSSMGEPTAHRAGCQDLTKVRRKRDYCGEYTAEFFSLAELSLDFWQDIIQHDNGLEGDEAVEMAIGYLDEIKVAPCVKLPLR